MKQQVRETMAFRTADRRKPARVLFIVILATLAAGSAYGLGNLEVYTFGTPAPSVSVTYDANMENDLTESIAVSRIVSGTGATSFFVTFSPGGSYSFVNRVATSGAGNHVNYQLVDDATARNILKDLSTSLQPQNVLSGSDPTTGVNTYTLDFTAIIPAGQVVVAGTYTDSVTTTLYAGTLSSYTQKATRAMPVSIVVPATAALSLVPSGGSFVPGNTNGTLDFGTLSQGESRSIDLLVKSNGTYQVSLQSFQGNELAITTPGDTSVIPYTFQFNGSQVSLPAGVSVLVVPSASASMGAGTRYPISATIGSLGNPTAGTYQDSITITVTVN